MLDRCVADSQCALAKSKTEVMCSGGKFDLWVILALLLVFLLRLLSVGGVLLILFFWLRYALGTAMITRIDTDSTALPLSTGNPSNTVYLGVFLANLAASVVYDGGHHKPDIVIDENIDTLNGF